MMSVPATRDADLSRSRSFCSRYRTLVQVSSLLCLRYTSV